MNKRIKEEEGQRKGKGDSPGPHVVANIAKHNNCHAIRSCDLINVGERKQRRVKGKGKHRQWLPSAILRCCWGTPPRQQTFRRYDIICNL